MAIAGAGVTVIGTAVAFKWQSVQTQTAPNTERQTSNTKTAQGATQDTDVLYQQAISLLKKGGTDNQREASRLLVQAADGGSAAAQRKLGWHLRHGIGVKRDFSAAVHRYKQAVEQGDAQAQYELSVHYMSGLGVKYDPKEARRLAELSAAQGYEAACNALRGKDPRHEAVLKRASDPNTGIPKRVRDDGIDVVENAPRNAFGTGSRTANSQSVV